MHKRVIDTVGGLEQAMRGFDDNNDNDRFIENCIQKLKIYILKLQNIDCERWKTLDICE